MKIMFYILVGLVAIVSLYFIGLSISSRKQPDLGLIEGQLRACPASPNCVCSERQDEVAFVEPLMTTTMGDSAWDNAKKAIVESGGVIVTDQAGYLHAQFMTSIVRYIDDVELRMDDDNQVIHIRSASRVGYSDMGANRMRVEKIRMVFLKNIKSDK
ncbi:MAG: DUF1499 domain-containing protein [Porticoccus sp.]|nr:DUF1499 domain-containing protein [Porticoccus sp.]